MNIDDFIIKEDVFILDEHELKNASGKVITKFDAKKLEEIALRNNKRISDTGDEIPLVIGHTKDGASEKDQPELVGYASNLQVKDFFGTGRKAISATFRYFKGSVERAKLFPRRSVELWLSDGKLDPISLLGASTPERDLGLVQFKKRGPKKYSRTMPMTNSQDSADIVSAVVSAMSQSDVWMWVQQQMRGEQGQQMGIDDSLLPANEEEDLMPEEMPEEAMPEEAMVEEAPEEEYPEEGMEEPQEGIEGDPDESAVPEEEEDLESAGISQKKGPVKMSKTEEGNIKIRLSRIEKENGELVAKLSDAQKAVEDIRIKYQKAQRERDIVSLEHDGYILDRAEEMDHVALLDEATYGKHLDIIKKRYQRAPVGAGSFSIAESAAKASTGGRSKEEISGIVQYALDNGVTYEAALSKNSK